MRRSTSLLAASFFVACPLASLAQGISVTSMKGHSKEVPTVVLPVVAGLNIPQTTTSSGAAAGIGFEHSSPSGDRVMFVMFNMGTAQTLTGGPSAFAAALLNPATQSLGFSGAFSRSFKTFDSTGTESTGTDSTNRVRPMAALSLRGGLNQTTWQPESSTTGVAGNVGYFSAGAQFNSGPLGDDPKLDVRVVVEGGFTVRALLGNLGLDKAFLSRPDVLGVPDSTFTGYQMSVFVKINDIEPFLRIDHLSTSQTVQGLSGARVTFGVNALSALYRNK